MATKDTSPAAPIVPVAKHDSAPQHVELKPEVEEALKQTRTQVEKLKSEVETLAKNNKDMKTELANMNADVTKFKEEHDASQFAKGILDKEIETLKSQLSEQQEIASTAQQSLEEERRKSEQAAKLQGETATKLTQASAEAASANEKLKEKSALAAESAKLKEDVIALEQELREFKREDQHLKEQVDTENREIIELQNQIAALQNAQAPAIRAKDDEIKALNQKLVEADSKVALLKLVEPELESSKKRVATLEADLANLRDQIGQDHIAKARIVELESQAAKSQSELSVQHEKVIAADLAAREHSVEVDRLRAQLAQEQATVKSHQDKIASLSSSAPDKATIEALTKSKAAVQAELDAKVVQLKARESEFSNLKSKSESEIQDYKMKLSAGAAELKSLLAQKNASVQEHDVHIKKLNAQIQKLSTPSKSDAGEIGKLQVAKVELERLRDTLKAENEKLKAHVASFAHNQVVPKAPYIAGLFGLGFGLFTLLRLKQLTN